MPKQIQRLVKRTGSLKYIGDMNSFKKAPFQAGDLVRVCRPTVAFDVVLTAIQKEGVVIGNVNKVILNPGAECKDISEGDSIIFGEPFVFQVERREK